MKLFRTIQNQISELFRKSQRFERSILPMGRLFALDRRSFQSWSAKVYAIDASFGRICRREMSSLFLKLAQSDPILSRHMIQVLPDRMVKVSPSLQMKYLSILHWVCEENPSAVDLFSDVTPRLMLRLSQEKLISFLSEGLELFLRNPKRAEAFLRMQSSEGQKSEQELQNKTQFDSIRRMLTLYARGHCGEDVRIYPCGDKAYTDGQHIYLPESLQLGKEVNMLAYRVLTARCAGYLEFGTLDLHVNRLKKGTQWRERRENEVELERFFRSFPNHVLARDLFFILENFRIEQRVREEYPGVKVDMDELGDIWRPKRPDTSKLSEVEKIVEALYQKLFLKKELALPRNHAKIIKKIESDFLQVYSEEMTVDQVANLLIEHFPKVYAILQTNHKNQIKQSDLSERKDENRKHSTKDKDIVFDEVSTFDNEKNHEDYNPFSSDTMQGSLELEAMSEDTRNLEQRAAILREKLEEKGEELSMQEARKRARVSYDEMAEFLERNQGPAGGFQEQEGQKNRRNLEKLHMRHPQLSEDCDALPFSFSYPEWDDSIGDDKPDWCQIREFIVREGRSDFSDRIQQEYGAEIQHVRRSFEALRPQEMRIIRGVEDGEDLDFDRALEMMVDKKISGSFTQRIYQRREREVRDTAVSFLLDMSSSTNELANAKGKRILDVEKESLFVISEALDALGDDFSIYGFSGYGRDQAAFYIAKDFADVWNDQTRNRVGNMSWKMENRDGVAIRHCIQKLQEQSNRSKMLILLSDGKPLDCGCDHYAGRYAQSDVRKALQEARKMGIRSFCITVDPYGQDYLEEIYGPNGYLVITELMQLPSLLPKMYWRLTRS